MTTNNTLEKDHIDLHITYSVNVKLRHGIPSDFKNNINGIESFRRGVVFFMMDADGEFYGPFTTGDQYGPFFIKRLLDTDNVFVFA